MEERGPALIVLDASLVGPLSIPDEAHDLSAATIAAILSAPVRVPAHWRLEVANMWRSAIRRGRLTIVQRDRAMRQLAMLDVQPDVHGWDMGWSTVMAIADRHGLTPYDAAYAELAKRLDLPLATLDKALAAAAVAEGVTILDMNI